MNGQKLNYKAMKNKSFILIISLIIAMVESCGEPQTILTNIVHPDGSVTRKIEMRSDKNSFKISDVQVPFDSTWMVTDSIEINEKGDTTWIKRAEKLFSNVDEINNAYKTDSSGNRKISREAAFVRKFRWFNTEFRFSERIERTIASGYPVKDFLNTEELQWFYSPESLRNDKVNGTDSLKYGILKDTVDRKVDFWTMKNLISEWIAQFSGLIRGKEGSQHVTDSLKSHENELVNLIKINDSNFDSLWSNGIILKKYMSEGDYQNFKSEADTALEKVTEQFFSMEFKEYSVKIVMPGTLTSTNGFIDSSKVLLWPVKSDFFLTEPYEMWAESKVPNNWAWIVSGLFLVFVFTGIIIRIKNKG
jgi:hypothetical protein